MVRTSTQLFAPVILALCAVAAVHAADAPALTMPAPAPWNAVWASVLETRDGQEAMRPALMPLLPAIDAFGKAAGPAAPTNL